MKIKIMLISKSSGNLSTIKSMIQDNEIAIIGESAGGPAALDKIDNLSPDMIIMTLGAGDPDVLSLTERIFLNKPRCQVVLITDRMDADILQRAIRAGAHNVTLLPDSPSEFAAYLKSVYTNETARIKSLSSNQSIAWISRVITIFGTKGGLGKTTIATNIAVKLAESKKKVALIDLDLQFGDIPIFLDIEPKDTILELVQDTSTLDIDTIRSYMVVHSSGIHVLCAPKSPEYAELISADNIQCLLGLLRNYYDYVIIDTPPSFSDVTMTAIECSSIVLFVTGLDISILKNSKTSLSLLESLQQKDKVRVLINRAVNINSITFSDVQKILSCPIWAKLPIDYNTAVSALNRGVPLVTGSPKSKLSQSLTEVADIILKGDFRFDMNDKKQREHGLFQKFQSKNQKAVSNKA